MQLKNSLFVYACLVFGSIIFAANGLNKCNSEGNCDGNRFRCTKASSDFKCRCLDLSDYCDGFVDCDSVEDENVDNCGHKKCNKDEFQCYYGGCTDKTLYCGGSQGCADYSNEPNICGNNIKKNATQIQLSRKINDSSKCPDGQFRCRSGQCIAEAFTCDGHPHCDDQTDEHTFICENVQCKEHEFQCRYGACVSKNSKCNGRIDCADGSDEAGCTPDDVCVLPVVEGVMNFDGVTNEVLSPGTFARLRQTVLENCEVGYYKLYTSSFRTCGRNGNWTAVTNRLCLKMCPPLMSDTLDIKCTLNGKYANCSNPSIPDTVATPSCKPMHVSSIDTVQNLLEFHCQSNGTWNNQLYSCYPYCGQRCIKNQILINNGMKTNVSMAPWNVGVYESMITTSNYDLICGGSLIAPNFWSAHCFWKTGMALNINETLINVDQYKIAVGKYDRNFTVIDSDFTRILNVDIIYMNNVYDGALANHAADIAVIVLKNKVVVSNGVAPVCMDWNLKYKVSKGDIGKIVGWGETEERRPSPVLVEANLPYIEPKYCRSLYTNGFNNFVTTDKFCAGFALVNESSQGAQHGDSGAGLTFMHANSYFLTGITSVKDPSTDYSVAVFTDVYHYITWIRELHDKHVKTSGRGLYNPISTVLAPLGH